jgi:Family of unknown function (DUF6334)
MTNIVTSELPTSELPIGQILRVVSVVENEFSQNEIGLDYIEFVFDHQKIVLRPLPETDEVEVTSQPVQDRYGSEAPSWCQSFLGKKLQTVWVCNNSQGYQDQVIFAFDQLRPSIAFIAECSCLIAFQYEQVRKRSTMNLPATVGSPMP